MSSAFQAATLDDGTWIGELRPGGNAGRTADPLRIRVIEYSIDDGRANDTTYRLFTTILDPEEASAVDLAAAYAQRWEIETAFDELKTHQRGSKIVLRSKSPELVRQEIWGYLCCHYAIRTLMFEAADHAKVDTDRVSFVAALRFARRSISQARDFPPHEPDRLWKHVVVMLVSATPSRSTSTCRCCASAPASHRPISDSPTSPPDGEPIGR